jgi:ribonuclease HI
MKQDDSQTANEAGDYLQKDYCIFTDGSGQNGLGGYAALVVSAKWEVKYMLAGGSIGTTVPRQEMQAVLEGLRQAYWDWTTREHNINGSAGGVGQPEVLWVSDCLNLVQGATWADDGKTAAARKNNADQWAAFEWYERRMDISAMHVSRNNRTTQRLADVIATEMFRMIKAYDQEQPYIRRWDTTTGDQLREEIKRLTETP